jgi:putative two-component system response regulator
VNILLVDDNETNLRLYQQALKKLGHVRPTSFTSSAQALNWCKSNHADVVVVDYNMPPPDGLEFIKAFRSDAANRSVPIVMVTAEQQRELRYEALELGAADFLTKPVDVVEFRARLKNMLALADSHNKLEISRNQLADRAAWLASEVKAATQQIVAREKETIARLMRAAEFRDNETGAHILRMGKISAIIGAQIELPDSECEMLLMAAPMHDIGKVATPDAILLKRGKLLPPEWEIMKQHTVAGYEILKGSTSYLLQLAAKIALSHHEKFDGTGYPYGAKEEDIPLAGRICAVSDVFDALTSVRPYKSAWSIDDALTYIDERSGSAFDPALVAAFHRGFADIIEVKKSHPDSIPAATLQVI